MNGLPDSSANRPRRVVPVIMSGGAGTRLWPLSTPATPKQFHPLAASLTLFQQTVLRARGTEDLDFAPPVVVCNRGHGPLVRRQLEDVGVRDALLVTEPFGRHTAAVAVIAARLAAARHPGALVLLQSADHVIADEAGFLAAVARGAAVPGRIVTFGIEPTEPQPGYGYVQRGEPIAPGVFAVSRFVEKPTRAVAEAYVADGGYDWNSGIFLFDAELMLAEFETHDPGVLTAASRALAGATRREGAIDLPDDLFAEVPARSIDVAILERTRLAAVAPCRIGWADIGSWSELWRMGPRDGQDNVARGEVALIDTTGSLVWADGAARIGVIGLTDLIVIAAGGAVLVMPKSRAQEVKTLVACFAGAPPSP